MPQGLRRLGPLPVNRQLSTRELVPERVRQPAEEGRVPLQLLRGRLMRPRCPRNTGGYRCLAANVDDGLLGDQRQADLAAAGQLDINLRKELGVEQGPMLDPLAAI